MATGNMEQFDVRTSKHKMCTILKSGVVIYGCSTRIQTSSEPTVEMRRRKDGYMDGRNDVPEDTDLG